MSNTASTSTSSSLLEVGLAAIRFSRHTLNAYIASIPEASCTHQPCSGGNHLLWVMGHIAWTDDFFVQHFTKSATQLPEQYNDLFGMGSTPRQSADEYPPFSEVQENLNSTREALITWFRSQDEQSLMQPLPENWQDFAPTRATLMGSLAVHEGIHAGQVTVARKSLGLAPLM
ncbi:MAG: DinB family protein [Phycisphaerales bacterium]